MRALNDDRRVTIEPIHHLPLRQVARAIWAQVKWPFPSINAEPIAHLPLYAFCKLRIISLAQPQGGIIDRPRSPGRDDVGFGWGGPVPKAAGMAFQYRRH